MLAYNKEEDTELQKNEHYVYHFKCVQFLYKYNLYFIENHRFISIYFYFTTSNWHHVWFKLSSRDFYSKIVSGAGRV